jgi:DnaJ-class molecular chaperone
VIADPCAHCRGEGRLEKQKSLNVRIPRASMRERASGFRAKAKRARRGGPSGRPLHLRPPRSPSDLPAGRGPHCSPAAR